MNDQVVLFGCGVGESAAIRLDDSAWMVVDSCRHPDTKEPVALKYLRDIGVDVSRDVKLFLITHWHDDHIAGASELLKACTSATMVFPEAMSSKDFLELVNLYGEDDLTVPASKRVLREFRRILDIVRARREAGMVRPFVLAKADVLLFSNQSCEVFCLSPSDQAVIASKCEFREHAPRFLRRPMGLVESDPNHCATAVWVTWKQEKPVHALLGADLETIENVDDLGWSGVLATASIQDRRALIFKIPHHGSSNGHHPEIWERHMVQDKPHGILTTYNRSLLPTPQDVERLKARCQTLAATTLPKKSAVKREPTVERTMRETVLNRRTLYEHYGSIGVRFDAAANVEHVFQGDASWL